jgi:DNA-binding beta-propeller fold protein YncE
MTAPAAISLPRPRRVPGALALLAALIPAALAPATAAAADLPLGTVTTANGADLVLAFDPAAKLLPGTMVAIYGPGTVEKHPLTKEVLVEHRVLVAKAQLLDATNAQLHARVLWPTTPVAIAAGFDVVPLPGEAAPNAPPTLSATPAAVAAKVGGLATISAPFSDPDGDAMTFRWTLNAATPGAAGRLDARSTGTPTVGWSAPGKPGAATATVVARDAWGHETTATIPLTANPVDDPRQRDLRQFAAWGGDNEHPLARLRRDAAGIWYGLGADSGRVVRLVPGWLQAGDVPFAAGSPPKDPLAAVPVRQELYVLESHTIGVYGADGARRRDLGRLDKATDLAIASDGTVFIADQGHGGIQVYEADGRYRCRLGRAGDDQDDFAALTRLAIGPDDVLYALDATHRRIQRFDRFQHHLPGWPITADPNLQPVGLAVHPRGLLLLLANGLVQIYDRNGLAREAMNPLSASALVKDPGNAGDLYVDGTGEVFVTYPGAGFIARHAPEGAITGVRGAAVHAGDRWCADGAGHVWQLDRDASWLYQCDAEGWRQLRLGGGSRDNGPFKEPLAVAACPDGSFVEVLDRDRHAVVRFDPTQPAAAPLVFGQRGKNNGQFEEPVDLAVDESGRTYVLDSDLCRVSVFDRQGAFVFGFGTSGKGAGDLREPKLLAVSPAGDAAYVYDTYHYEVKKFALDFKQNLATHVTNTGGRGDDPGQIKDLAGLGCDRQGLLYLADHDREDVQVIDFRGNSAVPILAHKLADIGLKRVDAMGVSPDGQAWLAGGDLLVGLRWIDK